MFHSRLKITSLLVGVAPTDGPPRVVVIARTVLAHLPAKSSWSELCPHEFVNRLPCRQCVQFGTAEVSGISFPSRFLKTSAWKPQLLIRSRVAVIRVTFATC